MTAKTQSFNLAPGRIIARKYEVIEKIGGGWEGEVYKIRERRTGIEHAAKLFFPHRDPRDKSVLAYAQKLHRLRKCQMVIQYHTEETIQVRGSKLTVLIAEYVDGMLLETLIRQHPGKRLPPYMALHMLHALCTGMEQIHDLGEYHGDLHSENIVVVRHGLEFELKLLDMYFWGKGQAAANIRHDTVEMIRVFFDSLGGMKHYKHQPQSVKEICCGMKSSLILKKYRTAGELRQYLEQLEWQL